MRNSGPCALLRTLQVQGDRTRHRGQRKILLLRSLRQSGYIGRRERQGRLGQCFTSVRPAIGLDWIFVKAVSKSSKRTSITASGVASPATVAPKLKSISALREAAAGCRGCDLWKTATRAVFGEGPSRAQIMFVGEQPGDQEDLAGHPFVGPAGKLLNKALDIAGIDHAKVYVTNVVKHFKWAAAQRGKKRIHKKPRYSEIHACRPWLDAELRVVRPQILVCLGSTAAQALLGRTFSVMRERGKIVQSPLAPVVVATVHPSSILRAPDDDARHAQMQEFVNDLRVVAELARKAEAA